jgi:tetratricopeptide (TPR) repeat protein
LATTIAPQDPAVQKLAARAGTLAQVAGHIEAGDQALARDHFQAAQAEYRKAVDLDPAHRRAASSLALASREVTAEAFRAHMSRGFAALERQDYGGARAAFIEAGKISPGNDAVTRALAQMENRESGNLVGGELERAADLESREEWGEAASIYERLLQEDPSLTDARVSLIPAQVRADLDERLGGYIEDPLRLSSQAEYLAAQSALEDARGIANPGQRLRGQIAELDGLLTAANSPVDVVFRSDNQTHVVLFRVADLGRFEVASVKLRPGKYVAAGTRNGYRDVRVEFTVSGAAGDEPIVVRCEEPVG